MFYFLQCDDCPKSFTRRDKLSKHQKSHAGSSGGGGGGGGVVGGGVGLNLGIMQNSVEHKPVLHFLKL